MSRSKNDSAEIDALEKSLLGDTDADIEKQQEPEAKSSQKALIISFFAMMVIGLGNRVLNILAFQPLENYAIAVNFATTFIYLPVSFAYIIPMIKYGKLITKEQQAVPKRKFAVMGCLDSTAGIMQSLATAYLANGTLVILLQQAAIPISMVITKIILKPKYKISQYIGAVIVVGGLLTVLLPDLLEKKHNLDFTAEIQQPSFHNWTHVEKSDFTAAIGDSLNFAPKDGKWGKGTGNHGPKNNDWTKSITLTAPQGQFVNNMTTIKAQVAADFDLKGIKQLLTGIKTGINSPELTKYFCHEDDHRAVMRCDKVTIKSSTFSKATASHNALLWTLVMVMSCVPMTLSSVYKEIALGDTDMDAIYMNGWVAFFQMFAAFPLMIPAAMTSNGLGATVGDRISGLPKNFAEGYQCMIGSDPTGVAAGTCATAPGFFFSYMGFNLCYNVLIILILKYGSANVLWLALTIMVPLGSCAFALSFVPGSRPLKSTDIIGLFVILGGIVMYRYSQKIKAAVTGCRSKPERAEFGLTPAVASTGTPARGGMSAHTVAKKRASARQYEKTLGSGRKTSIN